ncbi:hypothetical protein [Acinetobacter sp. ANC 4641]|uniref:hypothetical protein n=1 Tax=Acinetobacter sp. ANC 4641 TaxID=2529847 RepID=UPI00103F4280|nr:hypothetical protein [Acinetobacter sp. ANC 4641]TCB12683.1 hypothetical protein E0H78_05730 [Acinetobacter sp. ANC 4641]
MDKKISAILLAGCLGVLGASSYAGAASAPTYSYSDSSRTDNRVYAGLSWTWGSKQGLMPDYVVGFRSLHVDSDNSVQGGDINLRVKYNHGFMLDDARLAYVNGKRDFVGNYGAGYSFINRSVFGTVAGQGSYYRFGGDYYFKNHDFKPYIEINTLEKPDREAPKVTVSSTLPPPV